MKIIILGAGSFGTALANQLAQNPENKITLLLRDTKIKEEINKTNINSNYFSKRVLSSRVKASTNFDVLQTAAILFIAIPTNGIFETLPKIKQNIDENCLIVNMAKGLLPNGKTIVELIKEELDHANTITMKGASFSTEMMN